MSELNRDDRIRELFLKVFMEEGVSEEELKEAILQTYIDADFKCTTFEEIPINELETALIDCYSAGGLEFENADDILEYYDKKEVQNN